MALKSHAITAETPKNLMFGAGVFYKNLTYTAEAWSGTVVGATSGGGKFNISQEYLDAELDGATVKVKGAKNKVGETATMDMNLTEFTEGVVVDALHLVEDTSESVTGYKKYQTKALLEDDDYLENIAFVGTLNDGRQIIVIMENALCTSAFEVETKNKTQAVYACTFECHGTFEQDDLMHLPVFIYFPQPVVESGKQSETQNENLV